MKFLAETCLLTHGLKSVSNTEIANRKEFDNVDFSWVDSGKIYIGNIQNYLEFRNRKNIIRGNCFNIDYILQNKINASLTASGTMEVAKRFGIKLVVTCGMGGIGNIKEEKLCPDLPKLAEHSVALISTSPKDMLNIYATFDWLEKNNVNVVSESKCTGYVFNIHNIEISKLKEKVSEKLILDTLKYKGLLILNPIDNLLRIRNEDILDQAVIFAKEREKEGMDFHPSANLKLDELTDGYSSRLQLYSFAKNIELAKTIQ